MSRTICTVAALSALVSACPSLRAQVDAQGPAPGIRIEPVRVARVKVEGGVARLDGDWMSYPLPSLRSQRFPVPAFDCAGDRGGLGPYDPQLHGDGASPCEMSCNPNTFTFPKNPNTIEDMQAIHAAPGSLLSAIHARFFWGVPAPSPLVIIYIFFEDVLQGCPDPAQFTPTGYGIALDFGPAVPPSTPFSYETRPSGLDVIGMQFPAVDHDGDGFPDGSYQMIFADHITPSGPVLVRENVHADLWMTGDAAGQCRVGHNNAESYDDTGPTDGVFTASECHDYTSTFCVPRFGKANAFFVLRCPADLNADGFVDGIDADSFANAFESGACDADFNGDCFVDGIDADRFYNEFESACQ